MFYYPCSLRCRFEPSIEQFLSSDTVTEAGLEFRERGIFIPVEEKLL